MSAPVEVPAVRSLDGLAPGMRARLAQFVTRCRDAGHPVRVIETLRTRERQAWLYAQGRTRPGSRVTNAASAGTSMHGHGLAADVLPIATGWNTPERVWEEIARLAEACGLVSGRRFKSITDSPHVQFPLPFGALSPTPSMRVALDRGGPSAVWPMVPGALDPGVYSPSAARNE